jgi:hypothetical protein
MIGSVMLTQGSQDTMTNFRAQCFFGAQKMRYEIEQTEMVEKKGQKLSKITKH